MNDMTEIDIIKELFKAFSNKEIITVVLKDNEQYSGVVKLFDGEKILLDDVEIHLPQINEVMEYVESIALEDNTSDISIEHLKGEIVSILVNEKNGENNTVTGFVFDVKNNNVVLLTENEKLVIKANNIVSFEIIENTKNEVVSTIDKKEYPLSNFENSILAGSKEDVFSFYNNNEKLLLDGYTEDEITSIQFIAENLLPWNDDDKTRIYNQARRLYSIEKNRHRIAEKLFLQYISELDNPAKLRMKAYKTLVEIYEGENVDLLVDLYRDNTEVFEKNSDLSLKLIAAFLHARKYVLVKELLGKSRRTADFADIELSMHLQEKIENYDFSKLPGLDSIEPTVTFKEIKYLRELPSLASLYQVLSIYVKKSRYESFFALIDLCIPFVRENARILSLVRECFEKIDDSKYLDLYLPVFPLLWFDRRITARFSDVESTIDTNDRKNINCINQCKHSLLYALPNELEDSIIKEDYQLFDVFRSNDSVLISFGYTIDEVDKIKGFDVDSIKYGNKTQIERLLMIEGNRNYVAETTAGNEFLSEPLKVAQSLFPLLLEDNRGEMVYELYNYSPYIKTQLVSLKPLYLKALILIDELDEFWYEIKDDWFALSLDSEMLKIGRQIALDKGDVETSEAMNKYLSKESFNDFEMALINGDVSKLRSVISDGDYLVACGYLPEEIMLIQNRARQKIDFKSNDLVSIANRLYTFQKNKNSSAELYYMMALKDNKELAAAGLFSIFTSENRYFEICSLYEKYLCDSLFATQNEPLYLNALIQLGRYKDFFEKWDRSSSVSINPILLLKATISENGDVNEVKQIIDSLVYQLDDFELSKECILLLISNDYDVNIIASFYNKIFARLSSEDIDEIHKAAEGLNFDNALKPLCLGLLSLVDSENSKNLLVDWYQYLSEFLSNQEKIMLIQKIDAYYADKVDSLAAAFSEQILLLKKEGTTIPYELNRYQRPALDTESEKIEWMNSVLADAGNVEEATFDYYYELAKSLDDDTYLFKLLTSLLNTDYSIKCIAVCFELLDECCKKEAFEEDVINLIDCISKFSKDSLLSPEQLQQLSCAYKYIGNENGVLMVNYVLMSRYAVEDENVNDEESLLVTIFENELANEYISETNRFINTWYRYIQLNDDDVANINEIKDYYSTPTKWSKKNLNSLVKFVIARSRIPMYWKMLSVYYDKAEPIVRSNIHCHLATYDKGKMLPTLKIANDNGFKNHALYVLYALLKSVDAVHFVKVKIEINRMLKTNKVWFEDESAVENLLTAIMENKEIFRDSALWVDLVLFGLKFSIIGNCEREFSRRFNLASELKLALIAEKLLCSLVFNDRYDLELIELAYNNVMRALFEVPYKEVISDVFSNIKENHNSSLYKNVCRLIFDNVGDAIDEDNIYKFYIDLTLQGKNAEVYDVVAYLEKFYPHLGVFTDIQKYILIANEITDDEIFDIYNVELSKLKNEVVPIRASKTIVNMIPGEMYLKSKGYDVEALANYDVIPKSPKGKEVVQNRKIALKSLDNVFNPDIYPDLVEIVLKCCFLRKWDEFIMYRLDDQYLNDIIKNDTNLKNILKYKSFEILKSSVLCCLNADVIEDSLFERIDALFIADGFLCQTNGGLRMIRDMSANQRAALRSIYSLRLESQSLREGGLIGSFILEVPFNEEVACVMGLVDPRGIVSLFDNIMCFDVLESLPKDLALKISESYQIYLSGFDKCIFAKYLARYKSYSEINANNNSMESSGYDSCKFIRNKFNALKRNFNKKKASKQEITQYEFTRINYLYEATVNKSANDLEQLEPTKRDYISAITWLFNFKTTSELRKYLWTLESDCMIPALIWILVLLEQNENAIKLIATIGNPEWERVLSMLLYRCLCRSSISPSDDNIRDELKSAISFDPEYFFNKFTPRSENEIDTYVGRINSLRVLLNEYLEFMNSQSVNVPAFVFDEERLTTCLEYYRNKAKEVSVLVKDSSGEEKTEGTETVSDLVKDDYILELIDGVDLTPNIKEDLSNTDIYHYAGLLKKLLDDKGDSKYEKDLSQVRGLTRWIYILTMENSGYNREYLNKILENISEKDAISKKQWGYIISYVVMYFDSIESLQQLSRIVENDIVYLRNLSIVSNGKIRILRDKDLDMWDRILNVLVEIGSIDFERISDKDQAKILNSCRTTLFSKDRKNDYTVFEQVKNKLMRLIIQRITYLRQSPDLSVLFVGETKQKTQTIIWEPDNTVGTLYSVISNIGGADCHQVTITSCINMTKIRKSFIKTIYAGEKIPFNQSFNRSDLIDGKVSWYVEISYFNTEKNEMVSIKKETVAHIEYSEEAIRLGNISTGNPAKGKDFVGRSRELALLKNHYSDIEMIPSMLIRGLKRSGKSSIMIQLAEELKRKGKIIVAQVDGQSIGTSIKTAFVDKVLDALRIGYRNNKEYESILAGKFDDFSKEWKERLDSEDWIGSLDVFYYELSQLFGKKILILIDEMEAIFYNHRFDSIDQEELLYAALRSLIQRADNYVAFIFCGSDKLLTSCLEKRRESQMFQTLQFLEVGHMGIGDIKEIFRIQSSKYDIKFTADAVDAIWQYTNGLVWYAKLLCYLIINNIMAVDLTIRRDVNRSDVTTAVQMLINGEIGTDKFDLVDASLDTKRVSIVHAMASIMPDHNKEVSVEEIIKALVLLKEDGFINTRTGESVPDMTEQDIVENLIFLEKMQFVDSDESKTKYAFTSELYRLFFRKDKRLHLFEERGIE